MSVTIAGLMVAVLGMLGVQVGTDETERFLAIAAQVIGVGVAWYGRYRRGDVSAVGLKTDYLDRRRRAGRD